MSEQGGSGSAAAVPPVDAPRLPPDAQPLPGSPPQQYVQPYPAAAVPPFTSPPPKPSPLPAEPAEHWRFLRTPRHRWWRPLAGLALLAVAFLVTQILAAVGALVWDVGIEHRDPIAYLSSISEFKITPALFLANNIGLDLLVPATLLLQWAVWGQRPRWLSSVRGGFRWRWMLRAALVVVPVWLVLLGLQFVASPGTFTLSPTWLVLLIGVLLTTPLQAAGEEYMFRGFIPRAVAAWFPGRSSLGLGVAFVVATLAGNVPFMLLHGAGDPWLNVFYLAFGLSLSVLAWRTGGLEAGVLIHATNNTLALVPTVLWGSVADAFDRSNGVVGDAWPTEVVVPVLVQFAVVAVLILMARRGGVDRVGPVRVGRE